MGDVQGALAAIRDTKQLDTLPLPLPRPQPHSPPNTGGKVLEAQLDTCWHRPWLRVGIALSHWFSSGTRR